MILPSPNLKDKETEDGARGLRNRIAGLVAFLLGMAGFVIFLIENRWDNHDTVKPIKALLGSILFIVVGLWYAWKGSKAEPWLRAAVTSQYGKQTPSQENIAADSSLDRLIDEELQRNPEFQTEYQRVDKKFRETARQMEARSTSGGLDAIRPLRQDTAD